jgi:hypothetical protein
VYPRIRVEGDARERGRQHGEAARERVRRSVEAYEEVFAHYTSCLAEHLFSAVSGAYPANGPPLTILSGK